MTKDELYAHPGWKSCTFEGAREELLLLGLRTTLREKLEWLEQAETLSPRFRANRKTRSNDRCRCNRQLRESFGVPRLRGAE